MSMKKQIYMVGIGGIGMSALAQFYQKRGAEVSGSDRDESPVTELLARQGIRVFIGHDACNIPANCDLLVYSDAVWEDNVERARGKDMGIRELSYFQALGEASRGMRTIAVAGTHGKTTTTGMLAKILKDAGKEPNAIIGSIIQDFGSNYVSGESDVLVVEACEYRDHLLELSPDVLVVTNIEWDHTDYFASLADIQRSFRELALRVPPSGFLIADAKGVNIAPILERVSARVVDWAGTSVPRLSLLGEFNRENARAAKSAALALFPDIPASVADDALTSFRGSWRRWEHKGETKEGVPIYDDYAHHPTAIRKTLSAAREMFSGKKLVVAFHPHLYTRTRDLMEDFAETLALADEVVLAPIYPAREAPIPGVTSEKLAERICALGIPARAFTSLDDVYSYLSTNYQLLTTNSLLITMGAGDIYKVAERLAVH